MTALLVAIALFLAAPAAAGGSALEGGGAAFVTGCLGDCDGDGGVTVDEIIRGVRIALGEATRESCPRAGPGHSLTAIQVLTYAVRHALEGCVTIHDFSGFDEFEYEQRSAYGFCPEVGSLLSTSLRRRGDTYLRSTTLAGEGVRGVDPCLDFGYAERCLIALPQPCRLLLPEEAERVRTAFARVSLLDGPDAACLDVIVDPCVINSVRWDDTSADDYPHSTNRIGGADLTEVLDLLASLDAGLLAPCTDGLCGDGQLNLGEDCDDGNTAGGDGCAANCTRETTRTCTLDPERSTMTIAMEAVPIPADLSGTLDLVTGLARFDEGIPGPERGSYPLVVRPDGLLVDPVSVTGLVCVCIQTVSSGEHGEDIAGTGAIACGALPAGRLVPGADPPGSARIEIGLSVSLLRDAGACDMRGAPPDGVCPHLDYGPDCLPCTADDAAQTDYQEFVLTTGRLESTASEAGPSGRSGGRSCIPENPCPCVGSFCPPEIGSPFDCSALAANPRGGLAGGVLVGTAPLEPGIGEGGTTFTVACQ